MRTYAKDAYSIMLTSSVGRNKPWDKFDKTFLHLNPVKFLRCAPLISVYKLYSTGPCLEFNEWVAIVRDEEDRLPDRPYHANQEC